MTSENENNINRDVSGTNLESNGNTTENQTEQEQSAIVEAMDGNICAIRQRRLVFYENNICNGK